MMWDQFVDTVLNLEVFAFIGTMIWLYFKKSPEEQVTAEPLEASNEHPTER